MSADKNDDIDQIMNELDELKKEIMSGPDGAVSSDPTDSDPGTPITDEETQKLEEELDQLTTESIEATQEDPASEPSEQEDLSDFRAGASSDEPSLEETLGSMKEEEPASGKSIFDQEETEENAEVAEEEVLTSVDTQDDEVVASQEAEVSEQELQEDSADVKDAVVAAVTEIENEIEAEVETEAVMKQMKDFDTMVDDGNETGSGSDGALTLSLKGNMNLKLKYESGGQEVTISFKNDCLQVELADGTEFKVPVNKKRNLKAVA